MVLYPNTPPTNFQKVVITGPESTGKSVLTRQLGFSYHAPYEIECARDMLVPGVPYDFEELREIASLQFHQRNKQTPFDPKNPLLFCDTDAVVFQIWSLEKFGRELPEATEDLKLFPAALYLLCRPDIPWEPDPLRENPHDRERLFNRYRHYLEKHRLPYRIVEGQNEERVYCAAFHIKEVFGYRMTQEWDTKLFLDTHIPNDKREG